MVGKRLWTKPVAPRLPDQAALDAKQAGEEMFISGADFGPSAPMEADISDWGFGMDQRWISSTWPPILAPNSAPIILTRLSSETGAQ